MPETIRSFVAIELPPTLLAGLGRLIGELKGQLPHGALRWVQPTGIHLTLQFLGEIPAAQAEPVAQALARACGGAAPFSCTVGGLGCFPNPCQMRVLWVGVQEPGCCLAPLQQEVARQLLPLGFRPDRQQFHPHLTLARAARDARPSDLRAVAEWLAQARPPALGTVRVTGLSLMRSDLRPSGAVYTRLAEAPLGG